MSESQGFAGHGFAIKFLTTVVRSGSRIKHKTYCISPNFLVINGCGKGK